ncbi:hypothetical protein CR513_50491, partial [Mucuna pruriens]
MKAFPFSLDGATKDWFQHFSTPGETLSASFWRSSFRHLELRPSRKKYVGSGSIQERLCMNIERDLINSMLPIHTIRSTNSY